MAMKGWEAVDRRVRDSDENKVEDFKEDVDTLLVFVCSATFLHWISSALNVITGRIVLSSHNYASH